MQDRFKHFLGYSTEEKNKFLSDAIIVLDANVLLNLYRFSKESRIKLFEILKIVEGRLYLTNQVCLEFFKNRPTVIMERDLIHSDIKKHAKEFFKKLDNPDTHVKGLRFENELTEKIKDLFNNSLTETEKLISEHCDVTFSNIADDPILSKILELVGNKVSNEFNDDELQKIYADGKERYEKKIPPGFEDLHTEKKPEPDCYGDLVIFKEMFELAKHHSTDILFITSDKKKDWWQKVNNKAIGPLPSLLKEFKTETGQNYFMYTSETFIEYASQLFDVKETKELIEESKLLESTSNRNEYNFSVPIYYDEIFKNKLKNNNIYTVNWENTVHNKPKYTNINSEFEYSNDSVTKISVYDKNTNRAYWRAPENLICCNDNLKAISFFGENEYYRCLHCGSEYIYTLD